MPTDRRKFIEVTSLACAGGVLASSLEASATEEAAKTSDLAMRPLDYGLSFIRGTAAFNAVRFWVESRTRIIDTQRGATSNYYQCASCKSENTFAKQDLFVADNYDFLPVFGGDDELIFRRPAKLSDNYRQRRKSADTWGKPELMLHEAANCTVLGDWDMIRQATHRGLPLVAQTEIADAKSGLRAIIECPIKTMNVSLERRMYQVDTGPIALPDLSRRYQPEIESLRLAFVAFNAADFADFVIEQPTPVLENGKELCKVHHYSGPISLRARNTLLAIGTL